MIRGFASSVTKISPNLIKLTQIHQCTQRLLHSDRIPEPKVNPIVINTIARFQLSDQTEKYYYRSSPCNYICSSILMRDPCGKNNNFKQEEEECTITPCCRPFRLLKEHPMRKKKTDDKCGKDKKPNSQGKS